MSFNSGRARVVTLLMLFSSLTFAQDPTIPPDYVEPADTVNKQANSDQQQSQAAFTQQELDQMLAPIALYPDSLLSQILMAATYPLEVVQAARWSNANPDLKGDQAVKAVENNNWDPSVISLVAFPQILAMMDEKLDWTEHLGDAFLDQQSQVMDTVQNLRQKAMDAGNLQSNDQIRVAPQGQTIVIEQAAPQVVYVPYYNPTVVYGRWWWDAYPPVYWNPWPGYYQRSGFNTGFYWGLGITVGNGFFFGNFDWHQRHVNVINVHNYYYNRYYTQRANRGGPQDNANRPRPNNGSAWQHDPDHRRGVPYREPSVQQQFGRSTSSSTNGSPEARRNERARDADGKKRENRTDRQPGLNPATANPSEPNRSKPDFPRSNGAGSNAPKNNAQSGASNSDKQESVSRSSVGSGSSKPSITSVIRNTPEANPHHPDSAGNNNQRQQTERQQLDRPQAVPAKRESSGAGLNHNQEHMAPVHRSNEGQRPDNSHRSQGEKPH